MFLSKFFSFFRQIFIIFFNLPTRRLCIDFNTKFVLEILYLFEKEVYFLGYNLLNDLICIF